jgi:hypothetical protein
MLNRLDMILDRLWLMLNWLNMILDCMWLMLDRLDLDLGHLWLMLFRLDMILDFMWLMLDRLDMDLGYLWLMLDRLDMILDCLWLMLDRLQGFRSCDLKLIYAWHRMVFYHLGLNKIMLLLVLRGLVKVRLRLVFIAFFIQDLHRTLGRFAFLVGVRKRV